MFRSFGTVLRQSSKILSRQNILPAISATPSRFYTIDYEPIEDFTVRIVKGLTDPNIDGWLARKYLAEIQEYDHFPEPELIILGLKACRKVNEINLAIRFIEATKFKCQSNKDVWPYLLQEIQPTLTELNIPSLEELGYDKPELALKSVFDM